MESNIEQRVELLQEKYAQMGQDMLAYMDGLLLSNYLTYWEYIHTDTLMTLQRPRTDFPDEMVFIGYHQITELYFKLTLHEMEQIAYNGKTVLPNGEDQGWRTSLTPEFLKQRLKRINNYFEALTHSFRIMIEGMEKEQFLRFRMALLPSSGFQSAQYRMIELCATPMFNLVHRDERHRFSGPDDARVKEMFDHIYWKEGAKELSSGKKTLTLRQFEAKYEEQLIALAERFIDRNIWLKYMGLSPEQREDPELIQQMKEFDLNVNVRWPLVHYRSAARYLKTGNDEVSATGGTNWQQYLPPRFQKRIFFPELWSEKETEEWGKAAFI